jgi:hypothetical protein
MDSRPPDHQTADTSAHNSNQRQGGTAARPGAPAFLLLGLLLLAAMPRAQAQFEIEETRRVWLRALLDVRVARGGEAPSWTDHGPGKTRYGGELTNGSFERKTRYPLAQLDLELGAALPGDVRLQIQLNVQEDLADSYDPALVEASVRKEWSSDARGFGVQSGVMNVPFSLEHVGPAWSPDYALSASALNSWLWEDISLAGVEGEWWRETEAGLRLGALIGTGFGLDLHGRLLALRGWTLGDGLSGRNSDLPLPAPGVRTSIYEERDDRLAAYTWLTLDGAADRASLRLGYLDNRGDQSVEGVWHTRFSTLGVIVHPHPRVELLAQYLSGDAEVRQPSNDSSIKAYYTLVSVRHGRHRFSLRYDEFRVRDLDGGNPTDERGDALTLAWLYDVKLRHRIGIEQVWLDSRRATTPTPAPSQDGWQVSYRFRY